MIPLRDVIPSRTTPSITITLIAVNALLWLYQLVLPGQARASLLERFGFVAADFRAITLVSALFLHGSWTQVIGNLWFLWLFGENVEARMGHRRFLAFYLLCGAGAMLAHAAVTAATGRPAVGSGGAVAAVMGAYFVLYPQSRVLMLVPLIVIWEIVEVPAILLLAFWLVLQLASAGAGGTPGPGGSGVAFAANLAGLALGATSVFLFRRHRTLQWD